MCISVWQEKNSKFFSWSDKSFRTFPFRVSVCVCVQPPGAGIEIFFINHESKAYLHESGRDSYPAAETPPRLAGVLSMTFVYDVR